MLTRFSGIYVEDDERWPRHFRGLGLRIEDSICIGPSSPNILTREAVKEVGIKDSFESGRSDTNNHTDQRNRGLEDRLSVLRRDRAATRVQRMCPRLRSVRFWGFHNIVIQEMMNVTRSESGTTLLYVPLHVPKPWSKCRADSVLG